MDHHVFSFSAMSCRNEIQLFADERETAQAAFEEAEAEVHRLERLWSRYRPDSMVTRINEAAGIGPVRVDEETAGLLDYAATAWRESGGLFDVTSGVFRRVWNFSSGRIPDDDAVRNCLPLVGWEKVVWQCPEVFLPLPGMEIDFGGLGKEYAADRAAGVLSGHGCIALVNLGGDIVASAPRPGDEPWQVGIRDPRTANSLSGHLPLYSGAFATSGDYERRIEAAGRRYGHILNPRSGWPVPGGPASVSVLAPNCLLAGTLATVAMLKGAEAKRWLDSMAAVSHLVWALASHI
ncbi:MAG: FAD:protein FMN transferase [Rhodocyclaceae bacterium]|nr:MAG: FAD:protein FMN transferase [Rhodocyclaceae bacterium]